MLHFGSWGKKIKYLEGIVVEMPESTGGECGWHRWGQVGSATMQVILTSLQYKQKSIITLLLLSDFIG
jgi:hypothetical protein